MNLRKQIVSTAHRAWARGWLPATCGSVSARLPDGQVLVTASGTDKGLLTVDQIALVDRDGRFDGPPPPPEATLHLARYRMDPQVGAVLHVHPTAAVVASRVFRDAVHLQGFELLKALRGVHSHDVRVTVPIVANDQDVAALAIRVEDRLARSPPTVAYLLRGDGLLAWGVRLDEAYRHVEALDALFAAVLDEAAIGRVAMAHPQSPAAPIDDAAPTPAKEVR